jgi:peptidoglycan/xylan/chitin deacetylase (PgdA/CDA1 family)
MRVRRGVAGAVAAFGLLALTLSGCGATGISPGHTFALGAPAQPAAADALGPAGSVGGPTGGGSGVTDGSPDSGTTPSTGGSGDSPTSSGANGSGSDGGDGGDGAPAADAGDGTPAGTGATTTSTTGVGPVEPGTPRADVIVGHTAHRGGGRHIALTFDDGPDPTWTPQVLALLAQYHAQATFCEIGHNAQAHPALVRAIVAAGDVLCDHTMDHDENLPSRPHQVKYDEIADARQAILAAAPGARVTYYRAPGGAFSRHGDPDSVQRIAVSLGMQPLAWSIDTVDWTKPGVPAIVSAIESAGTDDVVLLHDAGGDRSQTIAALRIALPWLVAHGYQFDVPA